MNQQDEGKGGQPIDGSDNAVCEDQLNYIEDLALELKEMASQAGYETLSGILDMASREARLRKAS